MEEQPIGKMSKTAEEFSKIIPEMFFDIICRIVPGIIFATVFIVAIPISLTSKWYYNLPVIVAVAYSISLSLDCFSNWLLHSLSMYWSWMAVEKTATKTDLIKLSKSVESQIDGVFDKKERGIALEALRSQYKLTNHSEKAVLIKILAEERFFKVMAFGLPISVVFICVSKFYPDCSKVFKALFIATPLLVVAEIVFIICIYDRIQRAVIRTFVWWKNK